MAEGRTGRGGRGRSERRGAAFTSHDLKRCVLVFV
jgi:hypothetical protein